MGGYTRKGIKDFVSATKTASSGTSRVTQVQAGNVVQKQIAPLGSGHNFFQNFYELNKNENRRFDLAVELDIV